jgi:predicted XRE-type DNA-binding protein
MTTTKNQRNDSIEITEGDRRGVFCDLFEADEAAELRMRSEILRALQTWQASAGTQSTAAKVLGVDQARISDIKRGKIQPFSLDMLVRLAARAGLRPEISLAA